MFAKEKNGNESFYRDGYTDIRGVFDYALSSSSDIKEIEKFSIFISSEEKGDILITLINYYLTLSCDNFYTVYFNLFFYIKIGQIVKTVNAP